MLNVGAAAPAFEQRATDGRKVSLASLAGTPVILYFFPKAFTPGCTIETKGFRDNHAELRALGFEVVGVSTDSYDTQCRFAAAHGVAYPMIADETKQLSRDYGVLWPLIPYARRITYVLDQRHIVAAVFHHEFQVNKHLDEVFRFCQELAGRRGPARSDGTKAPPARH